MRIRVAAVVVLLMFAVSVGLYAQNKAAVEMAKPGPFRPGDPVSFNIKLNEPLPKGAHFDFRISPVSADEEIALGSGESVKGSDREFRVSSKLPDEAFPGEWHVSVIYLFLPGAGWTHRTIAPNDLKFEVEGKPYPIPTAAEVSVSH